MRMKRARAAVFTAAFGMGLVGLMGAARWQQTAAAGAATAQAAVTTMPEKINFDELAVRGRGLLEKAKAGSGSVGMPIAQYRGHFTTLTARVVSGGGEVHRKLADFLFVVDGEGTEMMGGTVVEPEEKVAGEVRGKTLAGATAYKLHKGDFLHIPAGTPHQAIEGPGQSIVMYVIKVEEP